jgi:hypothetical protein
MPATIDILGVRHHGPGSARMVRSALLNAKPDAVLIEGPPDAHEVLPLAAHVEMKPPVALLVYEPDTPANAAYYPFAEFSPEWQAIRWGLEAKAEVRFIDLPWANRESGEQERRDDKSGDSPDSAETESKEPRRRRSDPLELLAQAAGFEDGEAWWGRLIEERRGGTSGDDPLAVFKAIVEAMSAVRTQAEGEARDEENARREAHMRRAIRAAAKEGYAKIAVVCGAFHAPALTSEAMDAIGAKADDQLLKGLPKRKTAATWIPWTYDRLSMWSGYGAGVHSPGWYEHLWKHPEEIVARWMTRVARLLRDEDLDASPAHIIDAARLARTLASMRGRSIVGLSELTEATLSVVCAANPLPLRVIERKLIVGVRLGSTPESAPSVPLQRDLAAQQKTLRLKVTADDTLLDLDQRKDTDLARSRLLHRLCILGIDWGTLQEDSRRSKGTFHEHWKLQWKPELSVRVVEAARWGNTVEEAAAQLALDRATRSTDLPGLTELLDHVLLADLPSAVSRVIARIQDVSAISADLGHLMRALPPLAGVLRYGNVRKTDAALVDPVVAGLLARICAGIGPACGSLDDDAAETMADHIDGVQAALGTLDRADLTDPWRARLRALGDGQTHGRVAGRCWRILLDAHAVESTEAATRLSLALSRGNDPGAASAWLEGFISGSGLVLVHDRALLAIIDQWVGSLPTDTFEQVCPIVRRTFSTFPKPERRQIGEAIKRGAGPSAAAHAVNDDLYNAARGELVTPVLQLILGDPL